MKAEKTKKQSDLLKLSFISLDYNMEGKTTTCKIMCKVNLETWEDRYGKFTEKMKDKVLKNYFTMQTTNTPAKTVSYRKVVNGVAKSEESSIVVGKDSTVTDMLPIFWVEASTTCQEGDNYDEDKGKMIARRKAKRIAYRQMRAFLKDLVRCQLQPMLHSLQGAYDDMECFADDKVLEGETTD